MPSARGGAASTADGGATTRGGPPGPNASSFSSPRMKRDPRFSYRRARDGSSVPGRAPRALLAQKHLLLQPLF